MCRAGWPTHCQKLGRWIGVNATRNGKPFHGACAELCAVPANTCFKVPDTLSDIAATNTEAACCGTRAVRHSGIVIGDNVVILGAEDYATSTLQWAKVAGAKQVVVADPYKKRREMAKKYPLVLISGSRILYYDHSRYRELKKLRKAYPDPLVQINPETALKLDIANGEWVYIETPEGRITQKALLTAGIDPRVVHIDGYWFYPEKLGEAPSLFGVWESNSNAILPADPQFFDYAGDYPFRALLCKVYKK